jgi:hypothetical protein
VEGVDAQGGDGAVGVRVTRARVFFYPHFASKGWQRESEHVVRRDGAIGPMGKPERWPAYRMAGDLVVICHETQGNQWECNTDEFDILVEKLPASVEPQPLPPPERRTSSTKAGEQHTASEAQKKELSTQDALDLFSAGKELGDEGYALVLDFLQQVLGWNDIDIDWKEKDRYVAVSSIQHFLLGGNPEIQTVEDEDAYKKVEQLENHKDKSPMFLHYILSDANDAYIEEMFGVSPADRKVIANVLLSDMEKKPVEQYKKGRGRTSVKDLVKGAVIKTVPGDGACQFHAILEQLVHFADIQPPPKDVYELRTKAVDAPVLRQVHETVGVRHEEWKEKMRIHTTYGDYFTLLALACEFELGILVIQTTEGNRTIYIKCPNPTFIKRNIVLLYTGEHYDAIQMTGENRNISDHIVQQQIKTYIDKNHPQD